MLMILQEVPNNEAIWAEIASQEQREHNFQHLTDAWSNEIAKSDAEKFFLSDDLTNEIDQDDSGYVYSKVSSVALYL